jgi:hypothetical protein
MLRIKLQWQRPTAAETERLAVALQREQAIKEEKNNEEW